MRILVLHAHPVVESFNAALHRQVVSSLQAAGHEVDDCDLYAENFNPVMSREERLVHNEAGKNTGWVESHVARLRRAEALVFVYPTWWLGVPAMLKGYMDRVWMPGVVFHLDGSTLTPALTNIRRIAVVTTYGSPWWYINLWQMRADRATIGRVFRRHCNATCRLDWHALYKLDTAPADERREFLEKVGREMRGW